MVIKVLGIRNKIENYTVDFFLWAGSNITASYNNLITNSFNKAAEWKLLKQQSGNYH